MISPESIQSANKFYAARGERYGFEVSPLLYGQPHALGDPNEYIAVQRPKVSPAARDLYSNIVKAALSAANIREAYPPEWQSLRSVYDIRSDDNDGIARTIVTTSELAVAQHIDSMPHMIIPRTAKTGRLKNSTVRAVSPDDINGADMEKLQRHVNNVRKTNRQLPLDLSDTATDLRTYLDVSGDLYQGDSLVENPGFIGRLSATVLVTQNVWHRKRGSEERSLIGPRLYVSLGPQNGHLIAAWILKSKQAFRAAQDDYPTKRSANWKML